jgi:hypothetical protein
LYEAVKMAPESKYVKQAVDSGLESVTMLHEDTPPSVIRWIIGYFNEFFDGAEESFMDKMKVAIDVQDAWRTHRTENQITVKMLGGQTKYEAAYRDWLLTHHKLRFPKWQCYDLAKSIYNSLADLGIFDDFKEYCENYVDFLELDDAALLRHLDVPRGHAGVRR